MFHGFQLPPGGVLPVYSTPWVSLETWPGNVQFNSQHEVHFSNLTEDSVFVDRTTFRYDVWGNDPDWGLVCGGIRIASHEPDMGFYQPELAGAPVQAGEWGSFTFFIEQAIDKGDDEGVWIDAKTADALEYFSPVIFYSGLTCASAVTEFTSFAWRYAIPGWQTWSPPSGNSALRWNSVSTTCPGPCQ